MNKLAKLGFVLTGAAAALTVAQGVRYALCKKAIKEGKVEAWIKEIVKDIPVEIDAHSPSPAYITDDKSKIVIRLSDEDIILASAQLVSFKTVVQSLAAHEYGHALDPRLEDRQLIIKGAVMRGDFETYAKEVIHRERLAWELGKPFAPNKKYFDSFNENNLKIYDFQIQSSKENVIRYGEMRGFMRDPK